MSASWMFDLIACDDVVRERALARHRASVAASSAALRRYNRVWMQAGPVPEEPHLVAEMDQAWADHRWQRAQTFFGHVDEFLKADPLDTAARAAHAPFVMLSLRWEALYPDEWRSRESNLWSPWTRKEVVLRHLGRHGVPEAVRPDAADLVVAAIQRPYRCKDWMYALLVRHVADAEFRDRIVALAEAHERAQFVLDVIDDRVRRVKRSSWRSWLAVKAAAPPA